MRNTIIFLLLLVSSFLSGQGIEFFHGTWEEAIEKAKLEDKLIFVDAYASWCGPCKRMSKTVFTEENVGTYYNQNYISLKLDMEKPEAATFRSLFPVSAYPTLFYFNEKGEVLKKKVGGMNPEDFLKLGTIIASSYDRSGDLAELYEKGDRSYDLVLKYVIALNNANKSSTRVANDFLRKNKDLTDQQKATFLWEAMTRSDSRLFDLFIQNRSSIEGIVGKNEVAEKIEEACWNTVRTAIDFESEELLNDSKIVVNKHLKSKSKEFEYYADYEYAKALADIDKLNETALTIAQKVVKKDAEKLHDLCNELLQYKKVSNKVLAPSEKIASMVVDNEENSEYLMTYSKILFENSKKKKAKKALSVSNDLAEKEKIQEWLAYLETKI